MKGSQPVDGMFGAEILPRKGVPLNISQRKGKRGLLIDIPSGMSRETFQLGIARRLPILLGIARMMEGRRPFNSHGTQLKHLPLGLWEWRQPTGESL